MMTRTRRALIGVNLLMLLAGAVTGCGKHEEPPAVAPTPTNAPAADNAPGPMPPAPAVERPLNVPEGANMDAVLTQLTRELHRWIVGNRRTPNSFEEFIASSRLQCPPPPAGKKYALTKQMKVVLVDR